MNFLQQIGQLLKRPVHSGWGGRGGYGWMNGFPSNGTFDYKAEAGNLWESSIPLMCLKFEQRASVEAEICVQGRDANGDWKELPAHPALDLLTNPNDFFDMHQLLDAIRFDYHLTGNAYLYKARAGNGAVRELWWVPSWLMEPRWAEDGVNFIDCYEYRVNGMTYAVPVRDIIHFRNGVDPRYQGRKGLSDFAAVLREVCTDNEAAVFVPTLLRNMGIPGVIVSPKDGVGSEPLNKTQREQFKEDWRESFTGERRGEPFVQSIPIDINMPGWSPQQLVLDKIRAVPEQRICGSFGLPASVLQLGTGLENSNTKAGKTDDRAQAYESCIIPTQFTLCRALTRGLGAEFGFGSKVRVWYDLSQVKCLQDDQNKKLQVLSIACGGSFLTPNEARVQAGLKPLPGQDELRKVAAPLAKGGDAGPNDPTADPASADTAGNDDDSSS